MLSSYNVLFCKLKLGNSVKLQTDTQTWLKHYLLSWEHKRTQNLFRLFFDIFSLSLPLLLGVNRPLHKINMLWLCFIFMAPTKSDQPSTSTVLRTLSGLKTYLSNTHQIWTFWNIYWPLRCEHDWAAGITSIIHRHGCPVWHLHEAVRHKLISFIQPCEWLRHQYSSE